MSTLKSENKRTNKKSYKQNMFQICSSRIHEDPIHRSRVSETISYSIKVISVSIVTICEYSTFSLPIQPYVDSLRPKTSMC